MNNDQLVSMYIDQKISIRDCAKALGSTSTTVYQRLVKLGVPLRKRGVALVGKIKADRTGKKFGRLTVLGISGRYEFRLSVRMWICQCDCGKIIEVPGCNLVRGKGGTKSCGCLAADVSCAKRLKNGTKKMLKNGYVRVYDRSHPNVSVNGSLGEHVMVMSKMLGRALRAGELVHHKNGIRNDNRPENLELWTTSHPYGCRVKDLTAFCIEHLMLYAPDSLSETLRNKHVQLPANDSIESGSPSCPLDGVKHDDQIVPVPKTIFDI